MIYRHPSTRLTKICYYL